MSNNKSNRNASERTPLINGEESSSAQGANHTQHESRSGGLYSFFLDHKHTPGIDSDSFFVRGSAYTWHVTKVTLLSSEYTFPVEIAPHFGQDVGRN